MNYGHVDSLGPDEGVENLTDAHTESRERGSDPHYYIHTYVCTHRSKGTAENLANKDLFLVSAKSRGVAQLLINNVIKLSDDQLGPRPQDFHSLPFV